MALNHPFRDTYLSKHHILAKQRGGHLCPSNTLRLWRDKHDSWHYNFGMLTINEIIDALYKRNHILIVHSRSKHWKFMFGNKSFRQIIELLKRIRRIKRSLKTKKKKHGKRIQ